MTLLQDFTKGFIKENPVFCHYAGAVPHAGHIVVGEQRHRHGLAATFVLICSNIIISLIKGVVPAKCTFLLHCGHRLVRDGGGHEHERLFAGAAPQAWGCSSRSSW
jgi:hypothetical protein